MIPTQKAMKSGGFSLVEIMVGMVIGLLGIIVIMQVYASSEARKKTTSSGGDAQTNGAIGLFNLQRELQLAGFGISSGNLLGCDVQLRSGVSLSNIAPVTINHASIPAGDSNTDTLLVVYGNANGAAEGGKVLNSATSASNSYSMSSYLGYNWNDRVIAQVQTRPSACSLTLGKISNHPESNETPIIVENGTALTGQGYLFNLGQAPKVRAYAIRNSNLTSCDYMTSNCSDASNISNTSVWVPIANNIVSLRAQYGRDTSSGHMDGIVDTYDQTVSTTSTSPAVSSTQCGWLRVSAIRLTLVARSAQREVTSVTTNAPTWAGSINTSGDIDLPIDLSANTDWQKYRYKKFETQVPIKNISWQDVDTSCLQI